MDPHPGIHLHAQGSDALTDLLSRLSLPIFANSLAIVASLQSDIEGWLRILSLVAAITYTTILIFKAVVKTPKK